MFYLAAKTSLFQCSGRWILIFNCMHACFDFLRKNWEAPPALPPGPSPCYGPDTVFFPNKVSCVKMWILLASRHCAFPEFSQILGLKSALPDIIAGYLFGLPSLSLHLLCKTLIIACYMYLIFSQVHYHARGTCSEHDMFIKAVISWAQKPFCVRA